MATLAKTPKATPNPIKLKGKISWACADGEVHLDYSTTGILRPGEIVLDCEKCPYYTYCVKLAKKGTYYEGSFDGHSGQEISPVSASCHLYQGEIGYIVHGTWTEEKQWYWWAELSPAQQ